MSMVASCKATGVLTFFNLPSLLKMLKVLRRRTLQRRKKRKRRKNIVLYTCRLRWIM
jgi:hypothetical protein